MNFEDIPPHIAKRHKPKSFVPALGDLDKVALPLPPVSQPYAEIIHPEPMQRDAVLDSSAKLDTLTEKALKFYDELLSGPPEIGDAKLLAAQSDAARTVMTTQLRVDDSRLRRRSVDTLSKLLSRLAEEEVKMKVVA